MTEKRYQVFVSSTYSDLKKERKAVEEALYQRGYIPVGMECFGAQNENVQETIRKYCQGTDVVVMLIAGRYGSTNANGISYTELEYDYFREQKIPILVFIREKDSIITSQWDTDEKAKQKLKKFIKEKLEKNHHCKEWTTKEDLIIKLLGSLQDTKLKKGWVRLDDNYIPMPEQTTIEYGTVNIKIRGTVEECENGKATLTYLGSSIVDSSERPVKYKDRVIAMSGILSQKFTPEATILNKEHFKRNPAYLEYEIEASDAENKLSFIGEIVANQRLAKKKGGLGLHIPYFAKYLIVNIDITEAPFIQDYKANAKLAAPNETRSIDPIFNKSSMTYTLHLENAPANSNIAFEWENDEVQ